MGRIVSRLDAAAPKAEGRPLLLSRPITQSHANIRKVLKEVGWGRDEKGGWRKGDELRRSGRLEER